MPSFKVQMKKKNAIEGKKKTMPNGKAQSSFFEIWILTFL
jgi:hypothetical protein